MLSLDLLLALPDGLLTKLDRATMAHSLEARCPMLDHRVVEWATSVTVPSLLPGHQTKPLLRAVAARYLPNEIVQAPKRGFEVPLLDWLRGPLADLLRDACLRRDGVLAELTDRRRLEEFLGRGGRGGRGGRARGTNRTSTMGRPTDEQRWAKQAWLLLMLALWENHADRLRCA
jgi:asparagine synthase (glutamine-hydrolysing)